MAAAAALEGRFVDVREWGGAQSESDYNSVLKTRTSKMSDTIVISYEPNQGRLSKALETDDVIGAVQRGHAEVNDALGYVLSTILKWLGIEKQVPKEFGPKIGMLRKYFDVPVRIRPLELLNAIRNPIMKDGLEVLDPAKVEELFDAINEMYGGRLTREFTDVNVNPMTGEETTRRYCEMSESHKFAYLSFALMFGIAAIPQEIKSQAAQQLGVRLILPNA